MQPSAAFCRTAYVESSLPTAGLSVAIIFAHQSQLYSSAGNPSPHTVQSVHLLLPITVASPFLFDLIYVSDLAPDLFFIFLSQSFAYGCFF